MIRLPGAACLALVLGAVLAWPVVSAAGPSEIVIVEPGPGDNSFSPATVSDDVGTGQISWQWGPDGTTNAKHNVRQDDQLFDSGQPAKSDSLAITPSAGGFHYVCDLHAGMEGAVNVAPVRINEPAGPDGSFRVAWAVDGSDTGNRYDVRFRINGGSWRTWKSDTSRVRGRFGKNGNPVTVKAGKTYEFEARSERAGTSLRSDWSPLLTVNP
ncbi:MAG: cupredoxin domain-containing protein [Solirubrobacterales bacterium]